MALQSFTFATLNGFYKGTDDDISWHRHGEEEQSYSDEGANSQSALLFGRKTYEMMASFWPTPMAAEQMPETARGMNASQKFVVSQTLETAGWENTTIIKGDFIDEIARLKTTMDLTILGSGELLSALSNARLIDTYQIMIDPVVLGSGTPLFSGISDKLDLKLKDSKVFKSGVLLLTYEPI